MPLYEYECQSCGKRFERIQKFSDPPADTCPHCGGGPVTKLLSSPAIQFKGFYITDYAKKDSGGARSSGESKTSGETSASSGDSSSSGAAASGGEKGGDAKPSAPAPAASSTPKNKK